MKPEDLLPPSPAAPKAEEPAPPVDPMPNTGTVLCEFCGCEVTRAKGEVINRSRKAKTYLDTELVIHQLQRDSTAHQERAERLERELEAVKLTHQREKVLTPGDPRW